MTGIWGSVRSLAERIRGEFGGGVEWVEPGNWITHAVMAGQLDSVSFARPAAAPKTYELAPDNVLIATSAPRPAATMDAMPDVAPAAASEGPAKDDRVARAG